jgi:dihydroorotate dehydrogenase electron transfer subunit
MIECKTSLPQPARIASIAGENHTIRTFVFDQRLEAEPGQFVMAWLPGIDEKPFSLVRADPVTLTICRVGPFTDEIFALEAGDPLWLRGPLGRPFTLNNQPVPGASEGSAASNLLPSLLLIAGGYGIAPLYFLVERARAAGREVTAIIGAKTASKVVFARRTAALGARVIITTDDGSLGERGLASQAAERLLAQNGHQAIYACGPESMLEAVETLARAYGMPAQLSYERYMRCGFGVCGSCSRDGWLVCHDGPVRLVHP